jgi:hypothetical protein
VGGPGPREVYSSAVVAMGKKAAASPYSDGITADPSVARGLVTDGTGDLVLAADGEYWYMVRFFGHISSTHNDALVSMGKALASFLSSDSAIDVETTTTSGPAGGFGQEIATDEIRSLVSAHSALGSAAPAVDVFDSKTFADWAAATIYNGDYAPFWIFRRAGGKWTVFATGANIQDLASSGAPAETIDWLITSGPG